MADRCRFYPKDGPYCRWGGFVSLVCIPGGEERCPFYLAARVKALKVAAIEKFAAYEALLTAYRLSSSALADKALTLLDKATTAWDKATNGGE